MSFPNYPEKHEFDSIFNAEDIVAYRKRLGRMPDIKTPFGALFCLDRGLPEQMRWHIPVETDLAVYFGRCLGAFVLGIDIMGFLGAFYPGRQQVIFEVLYFVSVSMIAVHAYGAWRRIQPATETAEIAFYALLLLLTVLFQPVFAG